MTLLIADLMLTLGLLLLALQVVATATPFRAIVMFTVFGLLMALVWARLGSPDLALAEAAIGAGLTGAMLLLAYRRLLGLRAGRSRRGHAYHDNGERDAIATTSLRGPRSRRRPLPRHAAMPVALLCAVTVVALGVGLADLADPDYDTAGDAAWAALPQTGVGNAVTAVLILFRGYDTLLEMLVLLAAWLGVRTVQPVVRPRAPAPHATIGMLDALLAAVVPSAVLVGGYLLHAGGQAPGGAFQAGAVLAAAGVLLSLAGRLRTLGEPRLLQRWTLVLGVAVFCVLGLVGIGAAPPLALPGKWAVYAIEAAMTLSIAITLLLLFLASAGVAQARGPR